MNTTLPFDLLRSAWLIREDALDAYKPFALAFLTASLEGEGKLPVGLFGEIAAPTVPENMALIILNGPLAKADICGAEGTRTLTNKLYAAASSSKYDSVLLYAENCPGGQVDGTETMAEAIAYARTKKPVIGAFSGMTCSAGVWLQTQCDELYATSRTDQVGCIGVMARMRNPKKVAANEDFVTIISDLSPDKNAESLNPDLLKQNYLNPVASMFHEAVVKGRGSKLKLDKENVLSGATYIATVAKEHGLIDGIMPIHKIIARTQFLARTKKSNR